jgi:hypothetical protein
VSTGGRVHPSTQGTTNGEQEYPLALPDAYLIRLCAAPPEGGSALKRSQADFDLARQLLGICEACHTDKMAPHPTRWVVPDVGNATSPSICLSTLSSAGRRGLMDREPTIRPAVASINALVSSCDRREQANTRGGGRTVRDLSRAIEHLWNHPAKMSPDDQHMPCAVCGRWATSWGSTRCHPGDGRRRRPLVQTGHSFLPREGNHGHPHHRQQASGLR